MKHYFFIIFLLLTPFLFSYEAVLIDFNNLKNTEINFSTYTEGIFWTDEEKQSMTVDLNPRNWIARVNDSSWTNDARNKTYTIAITNSLNYPNQTLLGVRIYFPERFANSYAMIKPPYTIPTFYENPNDVTGMGDMFIQKGVVRNVGVVRKLGVRFLGNNFKYSLYVRVENDKGDEKDIFIGFMDFVGWKTKTWINQNLEFELKMRDAYKNARPYYPDEYPYLKFIAFIVHRAEPQITGNFVTMIKEVTIEYDEAFLEVGNTEYMQESIFGIYHEELITRATKLIKDVHKRLYLEWLENKRKHQDTLTTKEKTTK